MERNHFVLFFAFWLWIALAHYQSLDAAPQSTDDDNWYSVPIEVTGRALSETGKPIVGATVYISSQRVLENTQRIAETKTDKDGRYTISVGLPILPSDTNHGRNSGSFIIFGEANEYGFAWRPTKRFYPDPNPNPGNKIIEDVDGDKPRQYEKGEKIELDLTFYEATTLRGRVVDENGKPIEQAKVAIWDTSIIPEDGYGPPNTDSDRRPFIFMDSDGFQLLNADVPEAMWIRHTDADGLFEFSSVPKACRFRVKVQPQGLPSRMIWFATKAGMQDEYDGVQLFDASREALLTFERTIDVPIQVVYADSGKPAPNVYVSAGNTAGSTYKTTDDQGRVVLVIPPGDYRLHLLPAYRTPFLGVDSDLSLGTEPPEKAIVAKLNPAARVSIHVIDKDTGNGIENVDLWRQPPTGSGRELYYTTSWEVATRIVHRDRQRTNKNGIIHEIFEPGKHRIGVASESFPNGYRPVEAEGIEIQCEAGRSQTVTFRLEKTK